MRFDTVKTALKVIVFYFVHVVLINVSFFKQWNSSGPEVCTAPPAGVHSTPCRGTQLDRAVHTLQTLEHRHRGIVLRIEQLFYNYYLTYDDYKECRQLYWYLMESLWLLSKMCIKNVFIIYEVYYMWLTYEHIIYTHNMCMGVYKLYKLYTFI